MSNLTYMYKANTISHSTLLFTMSANTNCHLYYTYYTCESGS